MRRFPVDHLPRRGERVSLDPDAAHHLLEVIRLPRGDRVELFDGEGRVAVAVLEDVEDGTPWLRLQEDPRRAAPVHPLHVVIGVPKGGALDDALRMAVEAGATDLWPVHTRRSTPRGDKHARWTRVVTAAAQQCGRGDVPTVHPLTELGTALDALPEGLDARVAMPGGDALEPAAGPAAVLVGPEGGLAEAEFHDARARGFRALGLGRWILRTPTAVAVAVALTAPR